MIPVIEFENVFFAAFGKAAAGLAWFALIGFGVLAGLSAILAAKKRELLDSQRGLESLRALSWQQFEWMVGEAYRRQGYSVEESLAGGADGGIDLILRKDDQASLVQCKRWKTQSVGASVIREMFGLLAHHRADRVIVVTSGRFTSEAVAFADSKPIVLIDGPALLNLVQAVQVAPKTPQSTLSAAPASATVSFATNTPEIPGPDASVSPVFASEMDCPTCGASMIKRTAKRGSNAGNAFWGCSNYPSCRGVRNA